MTTPPAETSHLPDSGLPVSSLRSGAHLDRLAALEEERRFLLRSLGDLEREHDAGDIDHDDYESLKDGYTARAAKVLRQIESGQSQLAQKRQRRWGRTIAVTAAVIAAAIGIGFALANAFGERGQNQEITGFTPGDDARTLLASARDAQNRGDFGLANVLFSEVVKMEGDRGVDNAEAIAYFGWTLALLTRGDPDADIGDSRYGAARVSLLRAIEIDPDYADPNCFLAIVEYNFFDDANAALPFVDACETLNPPAGMADLIGDFALDIRAAATEDPDSEQSG